MPPLLYTPDALAQDSVLLARELLGALLERHFADGSRARFRIVETEAYTQDDPACHAYQRRTPRTETMFGPPGHAYIYFTYGIHHCLNIVTEPEGRAGAVLIRALDPLDNDKALHHTHGPARLTKTLQLTREQNGLFLLTHDSPLQLYRGQLFNNETVVSGPRIGIRQAKEYPWRFYIAENPFVSCGSGKRR
jgi:DNA-3-methyladenine glycosylase